MKNQNKALLIALTAVLFWATVATAFKTALKEMDYYHLLLFSSSSSTLVLFILIIIRKKWYRLKETKLKHVLFSIIAGLLNPFIYYLILFKSYSILPAQIAQPLNYTWPIMLVLLSIPFLKQKIDKKSIIALFMCMIGIVLISSGGKIGQIENPLGIFLALFSAVIWAGYWILNLKDNRDESVKLFMNFSFGLIYTVIYGLIFIDFKLPTLKGILSSSYVGIFEMGLTFFLWSKALSMAKSTASISTLAYIAPFLSLIFIALILGEDIKTTSVAGLLVIILGILYQKGLIPLRVKPNKIN